MNLSLRSSHVTYLEINFKDPKLIEWDLFEMNYCRVTSGSTLWVPETNFHKFTLGMILTNEVCANFLP